jgi:hypothetical protein
VRRPACQDRPCRARATPCELNIIGPARTSTRRPGALVVRVAQTTFIPVISELGGRGRRCAPAPIERTGVKFRHGLAAGDSKRRGPTLATSGEPPACATRRGQGPL